MNSQFRFNLKISSEFDGDLHQAIELLVKGSSARNRVARIKQVLFLSLVLGRSAQVQEFAERYQKKPQVLADPDAAGIPMLGVLQGVATATDYPAVQLETDTDLMSQLSATSISFDFSG